MAFVEGLVSSMTFDGKLYFPTANKKGIYKLNSQWLQALNKKLFLKNFFLHFIITATKALESKRLPKTF